jgi:hypothetical protein
VSNFEQIGTRVCSILGKATKSGITNQLWHMPQLGFFSRELRLVLLGSIALANELPNR